nr:hypothetical protein [candidate division Zixibacteria bacterium]
MFNDFNLTKLPPYGKTFIAFFAVLVMFLVVWMTVIGLMSIGIIGELNTDLDDYEAGEGYGEYDTEADFNTILSDDSAVTAPEWADSGEQEPIEYDDLDKFEEYARQQECQLMWLQFEGNMAEAIGHITTQSLLYFVVCLLFAFSTYPVTLKKWFFIILGILIIGHLFGLSGKGFCWPANFLTYFCGPVILVMFFIMSLMILVNLRKK